MLIKILKVTQKKYDSLSIERYVRFILNDANVQRISWETKPVLIDGKSVNFPKLVRKKLIAYMFCDYIHKYPESENRLLESSVIKNAQGITSHEQKARDVVDYVSGIFLYDNFIMLQKIIDAKQPIY